MRHLSVPIVLFILGLLSLWRCQSEHLERHTMLPPGNLGNGINSARDEINPTIPPQSDWLYLTTNREGQQDLWVARRQGNTFDSAQQNRTFLSQLLSLALTNDGAIAFLSDSSGIFATGHPLDEIYANRSGRPVGGLVGGTDLFAFTVHRDSSYEIRNLRSLNSFYWDAHPAVAQWNDTLLLIFSSDRPTPKSMQGFSVPFRNQRSVLNTDTLTGNADLYFTFFIDGKWTPPQNLNEALGEKINTPANEYSPFLFCVPRAPKLYFASDRGNGKLNLYRAQLSINFGQQMIFVHHIEMLPQDSTGINVENANEMFPFIPYPHLNRQHYTLFLASDRDDTLRHWDTTHYALRRSGEAVVKNVGGFDLYRFPIQEECRPPRVFYTVLLRNALAPSQPVERPVIEIVHHGRRQRYYTDSVTLQLACGDSVQAFGGSLYDSLRCVPATQTLSHYYWYQPIPIDTIIRTRVHRIRRTIVANDAYVTTFDTTVRSIPISQFSSFRIADNETILAVHRSEDTLQLIIQRRFQRIDSSKATFRVVTEKRREYDTTIQFDTVIVAAYQHFAPSVRTQHHRFPKCNPHFPYQSDVVIVDTIWLFPAYVSFPPCTREFTRDEHFIRNVPYFQTAFWEVNTPRNLERHLALFRTRAFRDAGFIELHRKNQYWGPEHPVHAGKQRYQQLWERRVWQYRCYARIVERNLRIMERAISDTILPAYAYLLEKLYGDAYTATPQEKLIIQVTAFSDPRPIRRGWYIGPSVRYFAAHFDSVQQKIQFPQPPLVLIPPHASLVGEDNDTLSKLRAYYGYQELLDRLRRSPIFQKFEAAGKVLLPTEVTTPEEFYRKAENCSILILIEGRYADTTEQATIYGYRNTAALSQCNPQAIQSSDFFEYDDVRRIDVTIHRIRLRGHLVEPSPCGCSDRTASHPLDTQQPPVLHTEQR